MKKLNFNDGWQEIMINNDPNRVIRWNPADVGFVERFFGFMEFTKKFRTQLESILAKYTMAQSNSGLSLEDFTNIERNTMIRELYNLGEQLNGELDRLFNAPVSKVAFLGVNPVSPINEGGFLFGNFLNALTPIIRDSIQANDTSLENHHLETINSFKEQTEKKKPKNSPACEVSL